jgi:hypothetical protein
MVASGPRPAHRRGTTGRPWRRFRGKLVGAATNCCYCQIPFVTDAPCQHPTHARLKGCPTYHAYPTVEHYETLIEGGPVMDPSTAGVACYRCNSTTGAVLRHRRTSTPLEW